jgi:hypothetical protein
MTPLVEKLFFTAGEVVRDILVGWAKRSDPGRDRHE